MNKIYYFSGTGNTLKIARDFAESLGNTELISISELSPVQEIVLNPEDETIGIFCPVYCFGIPHIVQEFLLRIKDGCIPKTTYLYAVCTSGGMKGAAPAMIEDILAEKKIRLTALFHIVMPSCYLPLAGPPGRHRIEKIFKNATHTVAEATEKVKIRKRTRPLRIFPIDWFGKFVAVRAISYLEKYDKYFWTDDKCNSCGTCAKVCPVHNISIDSETKRPVWHGHCEQCMGCIQFCPNSALQFRKVSLKRCRYHHPEVTAKDIAGSRF